MEVKNKVYPSKDQMRGFFETATDNEPIYMVNLLKSVSYTHLTLPTILLV